MLHSLLCPDLTMPSLRTFRPSWLQIAVVEFARNVLGWTDANSTEFDPATPHPTVVFMPEGE